MYAVFGEILMSQEPPTGGSVEEDFPLLANDSRSHCLDVIKILVAVENTPRHDPICLAARIACRIGEVVICPARDDADDIEGIAK